MTTNARLRALVELADTGSVRGAAERLVVTESAISSGERQPHRRRRRAATGPTRPRRPADTRRAPLRRLRPNHTWTPRRSPAGGARGGRPRAWVDPAGRGDDRRGNADSGVTGLAPRRRLQAGSRFRNSDLANAVPPRVGRGCRWPTTRPPAPGPRPCRQPQHAGGGRTRGGRAPFRPGANDLASARIRFGNPGDDRGADDGTGDYATADGAALARSCGGRSGSGPGRHVGFAAGGSARTGRWAAGRWTCEEPRWTGPGTSSPSHQVRDPPNCSSHWPIANSVGSLRAEPP